MKRVVIILRVIFLVLGVIGLARPIFNYHQQEEVAKIGPIKATVNEEKTLQIPPPLSIILLTPGIRLVIFGPRVNQTFCHRYLSSYTNKIAAVSVSVPRNP